jgi:2-(1,2-epoxy-1,2-dihydrophenyl)acetyl-CoA isomerase
MLVILEKAAPLATITLNRPERHNSLVPALLHELLAAFKAVEADAAIRVILLQANGRSFSTGGDVRGFYDRRENLEAYAEEIVGLLNRVILCMVELQTPIVTAVHGMVTGGSIGFLLASDIVLIAPEADVTPWYSVLGFSPDGGWTAMLPTIIGQRRTADILMRNRTITAEAAVAFGLANRVFAAEQIRSAARRIAEDIANKSAGSIQATKALLNGRYPHLAESLEAERVRFVRQIQTAEAQRGMAKFLGLPEPI